MAGTINSWNNQITAAYNQIILNAGINGVSISTDASAATVNVGTGAAVKAVTIGSTTASSTTVIQAPSAGMVLTGVQGVAVANKNYVTINTATGSIGSDAGPASSITITGDSGGGLTGNSFTFTGGTTGLTFAGAGSTETLGGTLAVKNGGTGAVTLTSNGVLLGNTTSAVTATAAGTTGQVLTGVTGSAPTFQAPAASSISITGNSGGALTGNAFTFTGGTTGLTFAGAGTTETLGGTLVIANGGTNATSMATSTGIVKYDGTRLVTSATAKIDSSDRQTNTSQPCFLASQTADQTNVTGDGTAYTVTFTNEIFDQNNNFDGTSTFTAPVTGKYLFSTTLLLAGLLIANDLGFVEIVIAGTSAATYRFAEGNFFTASIGGTYGVTGSIIANMTATDTAKVVVTVFDGTKVVDIFGTTGAGVRTPTFSGYLIC